MKPHSHNVLPSNLVITQLMSITSLAIAPLYERWLNESNTTVIVFWWIHEGGKALCFNFTDKMKENWLCNITKLKLQCIGKEKKNTKSNSNNDTIMEANAKTRWHDRSIVTHKLNNQMKTAVVLAQEILLRCNHLKASWIPDNVGLEIPKWLF